MRLLPAPLKPYYYRNRAGNLQPAGRANEAGAQARPATRPDVQTLNDAPEIAMVTNCGLNGLRLCHVRRCVIHWQPEEEG